MHGNVDTPDPGLYFLLPAAGMRRSRLASALFLHKIQSRFKDLAELLFTVVKTGRGPNVGRRVRAHGGQDIDTGAQ